MPFQKYRDTSEVGSHASKVGSHARESQPFWPNSEPIWLKPIWPKWQNFDNRAILDQARAFQLLHGDYLSSPRCRNTYSLITRPTGGTYYLTIYWQDAILSIPYSLTVRYGLLDPVPKAFLDFLDARTFRPWHAPVFCLSSTRRRCSPAASN